MEKIVYVYTVRGMEEKKQGEKKTIGQAFADRLRLSWPVLEKEGLFLDCPVEGYGIKGPACRELSRLDEDGERRLDRTLRKIKKRMRQKEGQKRTWLSENIVVATEWDDCMFPAVLCIRFYEACRKKSILALRAEQLIFFDGWEEAGEADAMGLEDRELTIMSEIYPDYNYVTIVTKREAAWEAFAETAYEEYGLSVRCVRDGGNVTFRQKRTMIVDLCREAGACCRSFPRESFYIDLRESAEKTRRISVKCRDIAYVSMRNALDTEIRDTV